MNIKSRNKALVFKIAVVLNITETCFLLDHFYQLHISLYVPVFPVLPNGAPRNKGRLRAAGITPTTLAGTALWAFSGPFPIP